jgi:hypothetical protein
VPIDAVSRFLLAMRFRHGMVCRRLWYGRYGVLCFCLVMLLEHTCSGCNIYFDTGLQGAGNGGSK